MSAVTQMALSARDAVHHALEVGGRARVTVTSRSTGKHLTILLACKKRGEDGRFISRARIAGRVGIAEADAVFADGGDAAFSGWIATLSTETGEWREPKTHDDPRGPHYAWAARNVFAWALGSNGEQIARFGEQAEVELASECSFCGKMLTDPESIERGIGPECFGRHTDSTHV